MNTEFYGLYVIRTCSGKMKVDWNVWPRSKTYLYTCNSLCSCTHKLRYVRRSSQQKTIDYSLYFETVLIFRFRLFSNNKTSFSGDLLDGVVSKISYIILCRAYITGLLRKLLESEWKKYCRKKLFREIIKYLFI